MGKYLDLNGLSLLWDKTKNLIGNSSGDVKKVTIYLDEVGLYDQRESLNSSDYIELIPGNYALNPYVDEIVNQLENERKPLILEIRDTVGGDYFFIGYFIPDAITSELSNRAGTWASSFSMWTDNKIRVAKLSAANVNIAGSIEGQIIVTFSYLDVNYRFWEGTESQYNALTTKDSRTLYCIPE